MAQEPPTAKPYMWVPMQTSKDQIARFNNIKLKKISRGSGATQSNQFLLKNFWGFIDYLQKTYNERFQFLHLYIGICKGQQSVPVGFSKKLILIFAPSPSQSIRGDIKYCILPKRFDPTHLDALRSPALKKIHK